MCAIIGYMGKHIEQEAFNKARDVLAPRGPDDFGSFFHAEGAVALGNRRLSIIDISSGGHQPMMSHDGRYVIVFNGEIFNYIELKKELTDYPFCSSSDTEVLLAAFMKWGKDCLNKLNGQFAFAIYDTKERELFCARDHIGIKPFFYAEINGAFAFASEIKALLALGARAKPNDAVIADYAGRGLYDHTPNTFFDGIHSLPAGYYLIWKNGAVSMHQYWDLKFDEIDPVRNEISNGTKISEEEASERLRELIADAVRIQFRSDVPVGISLSSGLDSGALYHFSKNVYPANLHMFTAGIDDDALDERAILEKRFLENEDRIRWHTSLLRPADIFSLAEEFLVIQDQPYGGMSCLNMFQLYKTAIRESDAKVIVEGQGMDELLAGYPHYLTSVDLKRDQYQDIKRVKIPRTLRYKDHLSMAFGKEVRVPFLDRRIVEFCFSLPDNLKIQNHVKKYLLRKIMQPYVPEEMRQKPKIQFTAFQTKWFRKFFVHEVYSFINSDSFRSRPYFNHRAIIEQVDNFFRGEGDNSAFLWQLINLEMWLRKFID